MNSEELVDIYSQNKVLLQFGSEIYNMGLITINKGITVFKNFIWVGILLDIRSEI